MLYARRYNPENKKLENITIQEFQNEAVIRVENAPNAVWKDGKWFMENGTIYDLGEDGISRTMRFKNQFIPYGQSPETIQKEHKDYDEMTIRELFTARKLMRLLMKMRLPLLWKFIAVFTSFASFVFGLVGAPLGVQRERSSSSIGFGLSVVIIFVYYAVMTFLEALGKGHVISAVAAVWLPNLIALICAVYLIKRVNQ